MKQNSKPLIEIILEYNEMSGGKHKLYGLSFMKTDKSDDQVYHTVKSAVAISENLEGAKESISERYPALKSFSLYNIVEMPLGPNPQLKIEPPKPGENTINLLKLVRDKYAKTSKEKAAMTRILSRAKEDIYGTRSEEIKHSSSNGFEPDDTSEGKNGSSTIQRE